MLIIKALAQFFTPTFGHNFKEKMASRGETYGTGSILKDGVIISPMSVDAGTLTDHSVQNAIVVDAAGALILSPVRTVAPRGTEPRYGFDKNGDIVEIGWLEKKKLYLIINDATVLVSDKVKAIDSRIADATKDALLYAASVENLTTNDSHQKIYAAVPTILSLAGIVIAGNAGGVIGKLVGGFIEFPNNDTSIQALSKKLVTLDYEVKKLTIQRTDLTGDYLEFDKLGTKLALPSLVRSSASDNTLLWVVLALLFFLAAFYFFTKKHKHL